MLTLAEIQEKMKGLNNWALETNEISKEFQFNSFKESVEFVKKLAEVSEKHEHYPIVLISNKNVRVTLTTFEERGLTEKDFLVAEEIDKINL